MSEQETQNELLIEDNFESNHEATIDELDAGQYDIDNHERMMNYIRDLFFEVKTLRAQNAELEQELYEFKHD